MVAFLTPLTAGATPKGQVKKELRTYFEDLTQQGHFTGSVMVTRGGEVILKDGFGIADYTTGKPNTQNTVYAIASTSKAFAAMSILILMERGMLSLDDKVSKFVPNVPRGDEITIHQMLNMTAGFYNFFNHPSLWDGSVSEYHTPEEMLQYFVDEPMVNEPGEAWSYCNSCYHLLGMVIEEASGMTYRDFIRENILTPLKMTHTSYDPDNVEFNNLKAVGYDHIQTVPPPVSLFLHPTVAYSAGGMFSTVTDMFKWNQALKTDCLVSYETLDKIFTPGLGNYGYGWYIENHEVAGQERQLRWHWGSYLGYHSFIAWLPQEDVYVHVILNITSPNLAEQYQLLPVVKAAAAIVLNQ
jgi:CubicO group peptidase (beta-lactamase class C family)